MLVIFGTMETQAQRCSFTNIVAAVVASASEGNVVSINVRAGNGFITAQPITVDWKWKGALGRCLQKSV